MSLNSTGYSRDRIDLLRAKLMYAFMHNRGEEYREAVAELRVMCERERTVRLKRLKEQREQASFSVAAE